MSHRAALVTPTLASELVRLEPIGPRQARAIVAGQPDQGLPWEAGFPSAPLVEFLGKALDDDRLFGSFYAYVIVRVDERNEHREPSERLLETLGFRLDGGAGGMRRFVLR